MRKLANCRLFFSYVLVIEIGKVSDDASQVVVVPFCELYRLCRTTAGGVHLREFFSPGGEPVWAPLLTLMFGLATSLAAAPGGATIHSAASFLLIILHLLVIAAFIIILVA